MWVDTFNPFWLGLAMEAVLNTTFTTKIFYQDALRQTTILKNFFSVPKNKTKQHDSIFLRRCFELFRLMDMAKDAAKEIIPEDPPLFKSTANIKGPTSGIAGKTLLNFVTNWAVDFLGKESSIKKHFKKLNYDLNYEQKAIHEINIPEVKSMDLSTDLKDAVILAKLFEVMDNRFNILSLFRYNPGAKSSVPKLSREYNWTHLLKFCKKLHTFLPENGTFDTSFNYNDKEDMLKTSDLIFGHREQTLCLIVRVMRYFRYKFNYPSEAVLERLEVYTHLFLLASPSKYQEMQAKMAQIKVSAAKVIQKWYRNRKLAFYQKYEYQIIKIQSYCKIILAKKRLRKLRKIEAEKQRRILLAKKVDAALKIQTKFRAFLATKRVSELRLIKKKKNAALAIQCAFRQFVAKKTLKSLQLAKKQKTAAITLQCWTRQFQARQKLSHLKHLKELEQEKIRLNRAVLLIQCHFRMTQAIKKMEELREEKRRNTAVIILQKNWRRYLAMQELDRLQAKFHSDTVAAIRIQSWIRMIFAKKVLKELQDSRNEKLNHAAKIVTETIRRIGYVKRYQSYKEDRIYATILLQSYFRVWKARKLLADLKHEKKRNVAALVIQGFRKMILAKNELQKLKELDAAERARIALEIKRNMAALKIQSHWRGKIIRRKVEVLKKEYYERMRIEEQKRLERKSAVKIQTNWRMILAKRLLNKLKLQHEEQIKAQKILAHQNACATKIQSYYKGYLYRKNNLKKETSIRRKSLTAKLPNSRNTLQSRSLETIMMIKNQINNAESLYRSLELLITSFDLLPVIQVKFFIDQDGLEYFYKYLNQLTQSPMQLKIRALCTAVFSLICKVIKEEEQKIKSKLIIKHCTKEILIAISIYTLKWMVSCKDPYRQNENSDLLARSLDLVTKGLDISWMSMKLDSHITLGHMKRFKIMQSGCKEVVKFSTSKYKLKPQWVNNARILIVKFEDLGKVLNFDKKKNSFDVTTR